MAMAQPARNEKKKMIFLLVPTIQLQCRIKNTISSIEREGHGSSSSVRTLCKQGRLKKALENLHVMAQRLDSSTYSSLLQGCVNRKSLSEGKLVHAHIILTGFKSQDIFLGNTLVTMYAKCGSLVDGHRVLEQMPKRDVVSWTVIIAAYARHGNAEEAMSLFYQMQETGTQPDQFTFATVLPACPNLAVLKDVHEEIVTRRFQYDVFVGSALVDMYAKCGSLENARSVFDKMPERNVVSWNAMIAGYAQNGHVDEAMKLFREMPERDVVSWNTMIAGYAQNGHVNKALKLFQRIPERNVVSWNTMIAAYAQNGHVDVALKLFQRMPERNVVSWNALIAGYTKNGYVDEAMRLFRRMPERNVVSWNAMIAGYAQNGHVDQALKLFRKMPERNVTSMNAMIAGYVQDGHLDKALKLFQKMPARNVVSWNTMITGYVLNGLVSKAMKLFQKMPERNMVSWTTMIAGYAQNGHVEDALKLFQKMPERDVVSWTVMIAGYAQNGHGQEALKLFRQMQLAGVKPDSETFAILLPACANLAALEQGKEVHEVIMRCGFQFNVFVGSALVDMYGKCGSIENARSVFDKMPHRDVVTWSSMILGYAMHGCGQEALHLFEEMQLSGTAPDHVTFVGVLSACCHAGLVEKGWQYFNCMSKYYYITPAMEHYGCMIDLLGRAGHLDEAQDFINRMPIKPDSAVWGSLLGACRIHINIELGEHVAERLFELDPKNAAPYVQLSNIYAAAGMWDEIENVRKMMKDGGIKKQPGCSWIEVNKQVHAFLGGERSHP
eukprot:Gb_12552 [translate_table: standard]